MKPSRSRAARCSLRRSHPRLTRSRYQFLVRPSIRPLIELPLDYAAAVASKNPRLVILSSILLGLILLIGTAYFYLDAGRGRAVTSSTPIPVTIVDPAAAPEPSVLIKGGRTSLIMADGERSWAWKIRNDNDFPVTINGVIYNGEYFATIAEDDGASLLPVEEAQVSGDFNDRRKCLRVREGFLHQPWISEGRDLRRCRHRSRQFPHAQGLMLKLLLKLLRLPLELFLAWGRFRQCPADAGDDREGEASDGGAGSAAGEGAEGI